MTAEQMITTMTEGKNYPPSVINRYIELTKSNPNSYTFYLAWLTNGERNTDFYMKLVTGTY